MVSSRRSANVFDDEMKISSLLFSFKIILKQLFTLGSVNSVECLLDFGLLIVSPLPQVIVNQKTESVYKPITPPQNLDLNSNVSSTLWLRNVVANQNQLPQTPDIYEQRSRKNP